MSLSLWSAKLGLEQGRIQPVNFPPAQGDYAFVLGSDIAREYRVAAGDYHEVSQSAVFTPGVTTLRFSARIRPPPQVPQSVAVNNDAAGLYRVTINGTNFDYTAPGAVGVPTIAAELVAAINAGSEPVEARLVGNGSFFQVKTDDPEDLPTITITGDLTTVKGEWVAQLLVDGAMRFEQVLRPGRGARDRLDGGALIRPEEQAGGSHTIAFRLIFAQPYPPALVVESEIPAFYVDNVTIEP